MGYEKLLEHIKAVCAWNSLSLRSRGHYTNVVQPTVTN